MRKCVLATLCALVLQAVVPVLASEATPGAAGNETVYESPEQAPEYPGGLAELMRFIAGNLVYPEEARYECIEGRVVVRFIITTTGDVEQVEVLRSVHPLLDDEAVRVCKLLSGFKPGMMGNKPVKVFYVLPLNFKLDNDMDITDDVIARANNGDSEAQYIMGFCYHNGHGVPMDWVVARYYLEKAAAQGHERARKLLERTQTNLEQAYPR